MICPICHGHRLFYVQGRLIPCPECEGHGEIHCCDGLQEQPETDDNNTKERPSDEEKPRDDA